MDFAACPDCGAPARLLVDTLAVCSAADCTWSCIVTLQHSRGGGLWYQHDDPGDGWRRRWCTAEPAPCR